MLVVTVSGIDKSGKTTLVKAINEATAWRHYVIERDPSAVLFFSHLLQRHNGMRDTLPHEVPQLLSHGGRRPFKPDLAVFLLCHEVELKERFVATGEPPLVGPLSPTEHQELLFRYFDDQAYPETLVLNTTGSTPELCADRVKSRIELIERRLKDAHQ